MAMTVRRLSEPSNQELDDCVAVLDIAFQHKLFLSALAGDQSLVKPFIRAHVMSAMAGGEVWVATQPNFGIVGVALWFGPGSEFLGTVEQHAAGWDALMTRLPENWAKWWDNFYATLDHIRTQVLGENVELNAYHLYLLGVHPNFQRKGIATALQQAVEAVATERGKDLVVETTGVRNIAVYERLGFTLKGSGKYDRANGEEGEIFILLKQPRSVLSP